MPPLGRGVRPKVNSEFPCHPGQRLTEDQTCEIECDEGWLSNDGIGVYSCMHNSFQRATLNCTPFEDFACALPEFRKIPGLQAFSLFAWQYHFVVGGRNVLRNVIA